MKEFKKNPKTSTLSCLDAPSVTRQSGQQAFGDPRGQTGEEGPALTDGPKPAQEEGYSWKEGKPCLLNITSLQRQEVL